MSRGIPKASRPHAVTWEMNQTDIYRKAIQRTFAELYSVPAAAVDVAWDTEGITVQCAGMTFSHYFKPTRRRTAANLLAAMKRGG